MSDILRIRDPNNRNNWIGIPAIKGEPGTVRYPISAAVTERVKGGTLLTSQIDASYIAAQLGFYYDDVDDKLSIFCILGSEIIPNAADVKFFGLRDTGSEDDPFELTLENAPTASEMAEGTTYKVYKTRLRFSNAASRSPIDVRFCVVAYDSGGNEIDRIYSSQYRYVINDGVATRTRVRTSRQNASVIEDVGLVKNDASSYLTFSEMANTNITFLPLVSTDQTYEYFFIVPDSWFDNAPYGYSFLVRYGDQTVRQGPGFRQAEDDVFIVTLTPTALDYSGVMDHTVAEILEAYLANKRIFFDVSDGLGNSSEVAVTQVGASASGAYPSFNAYIIMDGLDVIIYAYTSITDDGTKDTYSTKIYALTPYTP